jgi:hypothetical protein
MNAATLRTAAVSLSSRRRLGGCCCCHHNPQQCRSFRSTLQSTSTTTTVTQQQPHRQQQQQHSTFRNSSISTMVQIGRSSSEQRALGGIIIHTAQGLLPIIRIHGTGRNAAILSTSSVTQQQQRPYTTTTFISAQQQFDPAAHLAFMSNRRRFQWWGGGGGHQHHAWSSSAYEMWGWTTAAAAASAAVTYASLEALTSPPVPTTSLEAAAAAGAHDAMAQFESHDESTTTTPMQSRPSVQATTSLFAPSFYDATTSPAATSTSTTSSVSVSSQSPPRNVMLHRMRSLKGRSLTAKYLVDWNTVLGEGAYGSVHPARLRATGEKVALKKISRHYTNASGFKTETDALLRIYDNGGHPNISGLRDMYEDHNFYYLILDLVTGGEMFEVRIERAHHGGEVLSHCCGTAMDQRIHSLSHTHTVYYVPPLCHILHALLSFRPMIFVILFFGFV